MTDDTYHVTDVKRLTDDVGEVRWQAWCTPCGRVGVPQHYEADAWGIADRHALVQGFERVERRD